MMFSRQRAPQRDRAAAGSGSCCPHAPLPAARGAQRPPRLPHRPQQQQWRTRALPSQAASWAVLLNVSGLNIGEHFQVTTLAARAGAGQLTGTGRSQGQPSAMQASPAPQLAA